MKITLKWLQWPVTVQRRVLKTPIDKHANRLLRTKSSILNFQRFPEMPVTSEVSLSMELEV